MIRTFLLIAGASFVLAVACLSGAAALGAGNFWRHPWGDAWIFHMHDRDGWRGAPWGSPAASAEDGASATREIAWTGGDALDVEAPANIQFTQAPGPGKLVVTGPRSVIDRLTLTGSRLELDGDGAGRVGIVMTAPNVSRFTLSGDDSLSLSGFDQSELDLDISGDGEVTAQGRARAVRLDISGDGEADLARLAGQDAEVDISGAGRATVAPSASASLRISGDGEIDLLGHPANVSSDVSGAGRIVEQGASARTP
ncbi:MAG TPA: DUF2807 domain-containing protein [Caulobacteraceae bacterium]|nr:DUF2807 domain-containing protein [Caulobacteraceae bacterium]